ncbi:hypothetical protein Y032_0125g1287 [Ancylostoma ceylanicum]|uniref:RGS domain-containing protein n=1 Tax=Ancylostoma ceylanicum TaxID=53326 RepID=A0A016T932_9BILA|nr:hypothetical protein Y032_0125g1287 [Ancylostoma ceylanicum]
MRSPRKLLKQLSLPRGERRRRSAENGTNQTAGSTSPRLSPNEWQFAFDHVISDADGRAQFTKFLQSEYSEENILFWWAVEELKTVCSSESRPEFERTVLEMFETFIASESPLAINIDHDTRTDIIDRVENQDPSSFPDNIYERAQAHVYRLMEKENQIIIGMGALDVIPGEFHDWSVCRSSQSQLSFEPPFPWGKEKPAIF